MIPSILKKILMAITGCLLALFVLGHMAGNLQMFLGADVMNHYAHFLQNLPYGLLWIIRSVLLVATAVHVWMALLLTTENRRARPEEYEVKKVVQATVASKSMGISGSILLFFIVFHIGHFTLKWVYPEYKTDAFYTTLNGEIVYNAYKMVLFGFSKPIVSTFYVVSMAFLCLHLSHGVSSMFQSVGWRNQKWKPFLDKFACGYAWIVFLGFISVPISVILSKYTTLNLLPVTKVLGL